VFRFIIECNSSLRHFGPLGNNNNRSIFIWAFLKDDILGLCWNLRLVIELWYLKGFLVSFRRWFFWRLYFSGFPQFFCPSTKQKLYEEAIAFIHTANTNSNAFMLNVPLHNTSQWWLTLFFSYVFIRFLIIHHYLCQYQI
jgi:hypothetical protein